MKTKAWLLIMLCASLSLGAADDKDRALNQKSKAPKMSMAIPPTPEVRSDMLVAPEWLETNLSGSKLVILHVSKTRSEYNKAHIPGALFVSMNDLAVEKDNVPDRIPSNETLTEWVRFLGIDGTKRIIIYSDDSGPGAALAYFVLDYLGLGGRAAVLDGQFARWKKEKRTVSTAVPETKSSSYLPSFNSKILIGLGKMSRLSEMVKQSATVPLAIIDTRPEDEYLAKKTSIGAKVAGHIPGARNVYWLENIASEGNPVLKSPAELAAIYRKAGIDRLDSAVVYGRTSLDAALTYFVLKYLDYHAFLYDGSYLEWSARAEEAPKKINGLANQK